MEPHLLTGDIILSHERGSASSQTIALLTGSYFSHSAIYLDDGVMIESVTTGVQLRPFQDEFSKCEYVVMRCLALTDYQREEILNASPKFVGQHYDFGSAVNILRRTFMSNGKNIPKPSNANICTNLVVDIYRKVGIELTKLKNPTPKDLYNSSALQRVY